MAGRRAFAVGCCDVVSGERILTRHAVRGFQVRSQPAVSARDGQGQDAELASFPVSADLKTLLEQGLQQSGKLPIERVDRGAALGGFCSDVITIETDPIRSARNSRRQQRPFVTES